MNDGKKFQMGDKVRCIKTPRDPSNIVTGDIAVVVPNARSVETHGHKISKLALCVLRKGSATVKTTKTYCLWGEDERCYEKIGEMDIPMDDIINYVVQTMKEEEGVIKDERNFSRVSKQKQSRKGLRNKRRS